MKYMLSVSGLRSGCTRSKTFAVAKISEKRLYDIQGYVNIPGCVIGNTINDFLNKYHIVMPALILCKMC